MCDINISHSVAGSTGHHSSNDIYCNLHGNQQYFISCQTATDTPQKQHCLANQGMVGVGMPGPMDEAGHVIRTYLTSMALIIFDHSDGALLWVVCKKWCNSGTCVTSMTVCTQHCYSAHCQLLFNMQWCCNELIIGEHLGVGIWSVWTVP